MIDLEAHPKKIKKTYGGAFYWTCKFLKKDAIKNVSMLYAFYCYTKDIAELPSKSKAKEILGKLEEELEAPSHTYMVRLEQTFEQLKIEKLYAKEIISAARFKASRRGVAHHNQLIIYCYKNMGAVGLMMAPALGARNPKAGTFAMDLGIGANLVLLCANVLGDAKKGNIFFPKRDLNQLGLSEEDLLKKGAAPEGLKKLVEKYLDLADCYLESSLEGLAYLPLRVRIGVLVAARSCQEVGIKIRRRDYEVLEGKTRLSVFNKASVLLKTTVDVIRPRFWHLGKRRAFLHSSLLGLPGVAAEGASAE